MNEDRQRKQHGRPGATGSAGTQAADRSPAAQREDDPVSEPGERDREEHTRARPLPGNDAEQRPVPGVKHEPEPDAGNIMPAEDEPGTL